MWSWDNSTRGLKETFSQVAQAKLVFLHTSRNNQTIGESVKEVWGGVKSGSVSRHFLIN